MATNEADRKREMMMVKNAVDLVAHHGHVVARAEVPHEAKDEGRQKNRSRKCESECSDPCSSVLSRAVPAVKQAVNRHATVIRLAKQCVNDFRNT